MKILSGLQPTGKIHIGNYISCIKPLIRSQKFEANRNIFMIADMHKLSNLNNKPPSIISESLNCVKTIMACGFENNSNNIIFLQSQVDTHCFLLWLIAPFCKLSDLKTMTQYKLRKLKLDETSPDFGILMYPLLQAADIVAYCPNYVTIGKDQTQHLEFTRKIVRRLNSLTSESFELPFPQPLLPDDGKEGKIMSLTDPTQKMSKSALDDNSRINLCDSDDQILFKIKNSIFMDNTDNIDNIYTICKAINETFPKELYYQESKEKKIVMASDFLIEFIRQIRNRKKNLTSDEVQSVLASGKETAAMESKSTIKQFQHSLYL